MSTETEKILERIKKMLAIANDAAASEGERDNALRMAHAYLTKHQLSMEDVDAHTREREDPRGKHEWDGWNLVWCRELRQSVGKLFMCSYVYGGKINATRGRHIYVGRASNAATAMYMSDWLIASILKEADRLHKHRLTPQGRAFCVGATDNLYMRISALIKEQEAEQERAVPGRGLVLRNLALTERDANNAFQVGWTKSIKPRAQKDVDIDAYSDGIDFAKKLNLNPQLATDEAPLQITGG